jgi:hypothetical protein
MATYDPNAVSPAPAHPLANPGYGKRSLPDQPPPRPDGFAHLPPRERYVAVFIDRLPDGAAMDAKTLAKALPLYGQQAVRSALNELSRAGHLRRVRCRAVSGAAGEGVIRWVFRTYWSRTARGGDWWARFLDGDVPTDVPDESSGGRSGAPAAGAAATAVLPEEAEQADQADQVDQSGPQPASAGSSAPSPAYETLARLGRAEPRLVLSAADCAALEELASGWLARGVTVAQLTQALVAGLPEVVHSPRALVRRRLIDKMPPELPVPEQRVPRVMPECTDCGVPGRPEALPDGLCLACRGASQPAAGYQVSTGPDEPQSRPHPLSAAEVHRHAARVRTAFTDRRNVRESPRAALERMA